MKISNTLFICLFFWVVAGCQKTKFHIDGHVTGMKNGSYMMLFKFKDDTIFSVDTTTIQNNRFKFEGSEYLDDIAILSAGNYPDTVKSAEVILDRGTVKVTLDTIPMITGTPLNDKYNSFKKEMTDVNSKIQELIKAGIDPDKLPTDPKLNLLYSSRNKYKLSFISDNIKNPLGLRLFKYELNNIEDSLFQSILAQIPQQFRSDKLIAESIESRRTAREENEKRLKLVGKKFTDFDLITPENKAVKLSDYVGHTKFTVIEFWASWCGPCIAEVPRLKKVYNKYKDKGLEIVSISLDTRMNLWQKVIRQVDAPWIHLSDLKGDRSALTEAYGVYGVPHSVLINEKGIIVETKVNAQILDIIMQHEIDGIK
jgi:peroxiredoxin